MNQSYQGAWNRPTQPRIPFLATLNLPDLSILTNDPVPHNPTWPTVPTKIPSDIPKFEGKASEDPSENVTTFHLWCSSNSLLNNSIRLRLFQQTLMIMWQMVYRVTEGDYATFDDLAMTFLIISSYLYVTTSVPNSCQPSSKTKPRIFQIIFKSGVDGND